MVDIEFVELLIHLYTYRIHYTDMTAAASLMHIAPEIVEEIKTLRSKVELLEKENEELKQNQKTAE